MSWTKWCGAVAKCGPWTSCISITWQAVRNANPQKLWMQNPPISVLGCPVSPGRFLGHILRSRFRGSEWNPRIWVLTSSQVMQLLLVWRPHVENYLFRNQSIKHIRQQGAHTLSLERIFLLWRMEFHWDIMCIMVFGVGFLKKKKKVLVLLFTVYENVAKLLNFIKPHFHL